MNTHTNPIITTIAANISEVERINARRLQKHAEQCAAKRASIIASLGNNQKAINDALPPPPEMIHLTATGRAFNQALQRKLSTEQGNN
jgi:hypothetical protein